MQDWEVLELLWEGVGVEGVRDRGWAGRLVWSELEVG